MTEESLWVSRFARTAITIANSVTSCRNLSHSSGSWTSNITVSMGLVVFLLRAVREKVFPAPSLAASGLLETFSTPWLVDSSPDLRLHLHVTFDISYVCASVSKLPLFIRTPVIVD